MKNVSIKYIFGQVVRKVSDKLLITLQEYDGMITGVHYEFGHYNDIQERLIAYSKDPEKKQDRYPLVAVFEDDAITHREEGFFGVTNMKVLILHTSKDSITRVQREATTFARVLYPIYEELLRQIWLSGKFHVYSPDQIQHTQINRPHWGDPALYGPNGYLFTDILDGIELNNLSLKTYLSTCDTLSPTEPT